MEQKEFVTDGCTLFPDLWIRPCCVAHDYADFIGKPDDVADIEFLVCVAEQSNFLGPFAYLFAGVVVGGMVLGRPLWRLYKRKFREK